jgi:hypothetical protein
VNSACASTPNVNPGSIEEINDALLKGLEGICVIMMGSYPNSVILEFEAFTIYCGQGLMFPFHHAFASHEFLAK